MEGNAPNTLGPTMTNVPTPQPRTPQAEYAAQAAPDTTPAVSPAPVPQPEPEAPAEPVLEQSDPKVAQYEPDTKPVYVHVKLRRTVMINGKGYPADKDLTVPKEIADELYRIEETNLEYEADLLRANNQVSTPAAELKV
jgi:protein tolA|nr:MAG TPA: hypothetical protein [Caudoviricetes sp.]